MRIRRVVLAWMAVVVIAGVTHASPQPAKKDKKTDPGGLGAQWWQLVSSLPPAVNPFIDETKCGLGQAGAVWFLYSTAPALEAIGDPTDVTCTIPAEKSIFLSVIAAFCIPDADETLKDAVRLCAEGLHAPIALRLAIDGLDHSRWIDRRASRHPFTLPIPEDNVYTGFPASGVFSAVHDGYYALLPPLTPGDHTILVQAAIVLDDGTPLAFSTRHLLHIVEPAATLPVIVSDAASAGRAQTRPTGSRRWGRMGR